MKNHKPKSEAKVHTCGVPGCGTEFTHGGLAGRDGEIPLCPRHYHRKRRGATDAELQAPAQERGQGERKPVMFRPAPDVLKKLQKVLKLQARGEGGPFEGKRKLSMGELVERAVVEALAVWFPGGV